VLEQPISTSARPKYRINLMFFISDYLAYNFPSIVQIVKSAVKMRHIEQALEMAPGAGFTSEYYVFVAV
jgi:predicted transcriptional regulator